MTKTNSKNQKISKKDHKEVIVIKFIILLAVLLIPLSFMWVDISMMLSDYFSDEFEKVSFDDGQAEINFTAPLPDDRVGDLENVSQEKIDSLFDNLK